MLEISVDFVNYFTTVFTVQNANIKISAKQSAELNRFKRKKCWNIFQSKMWYKVDAIKYNDINQKKWNNSWSWNV